MDNVCAAILRGFFCLFFGKKHFIKFPNKNANRKIRKFKKNQENLKVGGNEK